MTDSDTITMKTTTRTETAGTIHGDVQYETVECMNCGNDLIADDAKYVGLGLHEVECHGASICDATHETYRESVPLCDYCAKTLLGYTGRLRQEINRPQSRLGYLVVVLALAVGALVGAGLVIDPILTIIMTGVIVAVLATFATIEAV